MKFKTLIWVMSLATAAHLISQNAQGMTVGSQLFVVSEKPLNSEQAQRYNALSSSQKKQFGEKHLTVLQGLAKILSTNKVVLGAGAIVGGQISQFYHRNDIPNPILNLIHDEQDESAPLSLREKGHDVAQGIISSIDEFMWNHLDTIAAAKDVSVSLAVSVGLGIKAGSWGRYPSIGLGLSLSYNAQSQKLKYKLFADRESVELAFPLMLGPSVTVRGMRYVSSDTQVTDLKSEEIRVCALDFAITMDSPDHLGVGVEVGMDFPFLFNFTPYKAKLKRYPLIKNELDLSECSHILRWLRRRPSRI